MSTLTISLLIIFAARMQKVAGIKPQGVESKSCSREGNAEGSKEQRSKGRKARRMG